MKYAINKENEIILADDYNPRNQWLEKLLCPCCKEPVKFVRESTGERYRTAHFRHKSGKKSQDCELYIPFSGSYNIGDIKRSQLATDNLAINNLFECIKDVFLASNRDNANLYISTETVWLHIADGSHKYTPYKLPKNATEKRDSRP